MNPPQLQWGLTPN